MCFTISGLRVLICIYILCMFFISTCSYITQSMMMKVTNTNVAAATLFSYNQIHLISVCMLLYSIHVATFKVYIHMYGEYIGNQNPGESHSPQ